MYRTSLFHPHLSLSPINHRLSLSHWCSAAPFLSRAASCSLSLDLRPPLHLCFCLSCSFVISRHLTLDSTCMYLCPSLSPSPSPRLSVSSRIYTHGQALGKCIKRDGQGYLRLGSLPRIDSYCLKRRSMRSSCLGTVATAC